MGPARRRARRASTATRRSATGCRPRCSACPGRPSTRRRRRRRSSCSGPTRRRSSASCSCGCAMRSSSARPGPGVPRTRLIELSPTATGLSRKAWRSIRIEAGGAAAAAAALDDPAIQDQLRAGPVVIVAGRPNLAESAASAAATLRAVFEKVGAIQPDVKVLPALRRGNVVGALQLGLRPQPGGSDATGILNAAAAGSIDVLVLLGADPLVRLPRRAARPQGARGCPRRHRARRVPHRVVGDGRRRPARRRRRREGGHHHEPRGPGHHGEPAGHAGAARPAPTGWSPPSWPTPSVATRSPTRCCPSSRSPTRSPPRCRRTPEPPGPRCDGNRDGVIAAGPPIGADAIEALTVTERNSYDYRLVVSRTMYDQAVRTAKSPSLAPLAAEARGVPRPARRRPHRRRPTAATSASPACAARSACRCTSTPTCPAAPCSCRSTSRAMAAATSASSSTPPQAATDVRIEVGP